MDKHTPTPLKQKNFQIVDANGGEWNLIPHYPDERGEAENKYAAEVLLPLIVRAVNAHEVMLAVLREIKSVFERSGATEPFKLQYELVCQAIAKAEEK